ncbi:2-C-methyl-D-erythritol 4-phosphate cytidylyltransferase [Bacteroides graminisolvens]|uniref:2-C-methyl-D-erythritol 4-phosphate cytidylyltransferase n=1 Tax=Bacteroides graminisolvens TaxID=477666 RepID=UPI0023EFB70C|nr:2-C-methyl-D-erythritol 4-phosphate cytidylyltransferase [Bacteroides graminisolvens]MDD3210409.1 2-C-methyl-D-erythritol 4-phosphate cytidylyltransferase [Bacteroides graminisolvens]
MKKYVLIVAGGKGLRMGGEQPKQFLPLKGRPVLMHTLEQFYRSDVAMEIILVLPHEQQNYWKQLCEEHHFTIKHRVADGGESRFHSVKNGLSLIETPSIVGVHDGVRPFVSVDVINRCYELALTKEAVVPVVDVVDTVRHITNNGSETVDRSAYKLVQTPQVFNADLLLKGYEQAYSSAFTDDASVVEAMGVKVTLTPGNRENIKLTTPFDLKVAEALL